MDDREHEEHERPAVILARLDERIKTLNATIDKMETTLKQYVTRVEFWPVKMIAFGMAGLILSAVIAALVAGLIHK